MSKSDWKIITHSINPSTIVAISSQTKCKDTTTSTDMRFISRDGKVIFQKLTSDSMYRPATKWVDSELPDNNYFQRLALWYKEYVDIVGRGLDSFTMEVDYNYHIAKT